MKLTEGFGLSGYLKIFKNEDGLRELVFEDKNLIVNSGRLIAINQLYYPSGEGDPLSYAKVGTGGAIDPAGEFPRVPNVAMTDLFNPVATAPMTKSDEDVVAGTITLLASLDSSAGNGNFINEAGFFSRSGRMFNIKVFPGIPKTSRFSLDFEWVIRYV